MSWEDILKQFNLTELSKLITQLQTIQEAIEKMNLEEVSEMYGKQANNGLRDALHGLIMIEQPKNYEAYIKNYRNELTLQKREITVGQAKIVKYEPNYLRTIQQDAEVIADLAFDIEKINPSALDKALMKEIVDSLRKIRMDLMPKLAESIETDGEGWFI